MMSEFTFESPAITASYMNAEWTIRREGKGDWLTFSTFGGFLYQSGGDVPVGSVYIDDGPTSQAPPSWSHFYTERCECGHGELRREETQVFDTPSEAVEAAAFYYLS